MHNNKKMWFIIVIAFICLLIGFYLYYFYPRYIPGMAVDNLSEKEDKIIKETREGENGVTSPDNQEITSSNEGETILEDTREIENKKDTKQSVNDSDDVDEETTKKAEKTQSENKIKDNIDENDIEQKAVEQNNNIDVTDTKREVVKKDETVDKAPKLDEPTVPDTEHKQESREQSGITDNIKERIKDIYDDLKTGVTNIVSPELNENVHILIIGLDDVKSVSEGKIEADALILLKIYPAEARIDLYNIIFKEKYVFGETFTESKGRQLVTKINRDLNIDTNTDVEYFVSVSYDGFINLIDNMDGININISDDFKVPGLKLDLKKGNNILSGKEALNYSRYLNKENHKDRVIRQQQIISAIINQAVRGKIITDLPGVIKTTIDTFKMVDTNIEHNMITKIITYLNKTEELEVNYKIISYQSN